jgi:dynein heavy chain
MDLKPNMKWPCINCCAEHLDEWRVLFDSTSPHLEPLPSEWHVRLGPFQRLLLLRALRQDKLTQAISKYVADSMGR